jgi:hypothetical protein
MATRSNIGYVMPNGNIRFVYCHWDGYPSYNGRILQEHYQSAYKIAQLVELGDLSSLNKEIGVKINFDDTEARKGQCVYYGRDRGEENVLPQETADVSDFVQNDYAYLWNGDEWIVYTSPDVSMPLAEALELVE